MALAALAFVGSTACSKDPPSAEGGMTTTAADGTETSDGETSDGETSTSTDTGDATTDTSASGGSFYAGPDDSDYGPSECDGWFQDCPEGEKCVAYSSNGSGLDSNKCVPVTGDGEPGDPCLYGGAINGTDDCNESSACWNLSQVDGQLVGTCKAFCSGAPDDPECPDGTSCLIHWEGSVNLCVEPCDPLAQDCADGFGCYWTAGMFFCVVQTQDLPEGDPCDYINDCEPGQWCAAAELLAGCDGPSCCTGFCSLGNPMCAPEQDCVAFFETPPEGYEDVGVCVQP